MSGWCPLTASTLAFTQKRYCPKQYNATAFQQWAMKLAVYDNKFLGTPEAAEPLSELPLAPQSYRCGVFINHHYKFIFIRQGGF